MPSTAAIFPASDPVGPAGAPLAPEQVAFIADVVAPGAADADRGGVPRATIDALAAAGLLGSALEPASAQRELAELIAGCDATTWFCWVQHQTPLRTLEGAAAGLLEAAPPSLQERLLPGMRSGRLLGAVAFAHVRRPGPPNPVATRVSGGWRFDGTLDWVTSWDIADVVMVMAQGAGADAGLLVCAYLPAGHSPDVIPGVEPGAPLDLLSMSGTHTRPVRLDGVLVPQEQVGAVLDRGSWLTADAARTADANPAAFGVARGAIAELTSVAQARADAGIAELASTLVEECREVRALAYGLTDAGADAADRLRMRAASLDLAARAALAVVTARAGAGMRRGHSAERRLREAMFLQVQAQTRATRDASLDVLLRRSAEALRSARDANHDGG